MERLKATPPAAHYMARHQLDGGGILVRQGLYIFDFWYPGSALHVDTEADANYRSGISHPDFAKSDRGDAYP